MKEESGKPGLCGFTADQVRARFDQQILIFRDGSSGFSPRVKTIFSLDVYNGATSVGEFVLISKLNGKTEFTMANVDCGQFRDSNHGT